MQARIVQDMKVPLLGARVARNFIIIEPDPIVAMDVEGILKDHFPAAHVSSGKSLSDVRHVVHVCGAGSTLFVRATLLLEDDHVKRVMRDAVAKQAQIVIIGTHFDVGFPAFFIDMPFTTEMLLDAVAHNGSVSQDGSVAQDGQTVIKIS
ncbi:hypothetical protein [Algirhabdus cladophorae]|uniref:hypothetical protein n=1 Tax=Algirhabdus cladophorae TaxID=3377108 RepID=UPI003B84A3CE